MSFTKRKLGDELILFDLSHERTATPIIVRLTPAIAQDPASCCPADRIQATPVPATELVIYAAR